ncbi:hypothetical protein [Kitasatospora terrestris]|uniref:Uncharacterized protein n=1 Tax=Kitasatospora terrestris TaxID=258051 RepID=A0ABP9D6E4_9ACTN
MPAAVPAVPGQLRLALAADCTATSPAARGLGHPTSTWTVPDTDLLVEGWDCEPGVYAVHRTDRVLFGWIAQDTGGGWATNIQGRQVVDATDRRPWLSRDAPHAISLLRAALDRLAT